jgi:hypothetical protein
MFFWRSLHAAPVGGTPARDADLIAQMFWCRGLTICSSKGALRDDAEAENQIWG